MSMPALCVAPVFRRQDNVQAVLTIREWRPCQQRHKCQAITATLGMEVAWGAAVQVRVCTGTNSG
jgi:hypothetical protein